MSDVREQLMTEVGKAEGTLYARQRQRIADAILARWDLVPKPVVTPEQVGRMVKSTMGFESLDYEYRGQRMLDELEAAGLQIVKVEQG